MANKPRVSDMPTEPLAEQPNYIRPGDEGKFIGSGQGDQMSNFIPDAEWLNKKRYQISREQEAYGLDWKPGDPRVPPPKNRLGGLNPISGEWMYPDEIEQRAEAKKKGRPKKKG